MKNLLKNIFSITNKKEMEHKIITILGIKIKIKKSNYKFVKTIKEDEIEMCKSLYNQINQETFAEQYLNLVKNLDDESINCVSKIIYRLQKIAQGNKKEYAIFTEEENNQLRKLSEDIHSERIKISNNCYAYKNYLLPINHFEASVFYYKHFMNKLQNLSYIENKDIMDVGAFIGDSAIVLSKYTNGNIYSFEPTTPNYNMMLKTIELNKAQNIIPVKKALGAENTTMEIEIDSAACSTNKIDNEISENNNSTKETIEITTLDDFVKEHNLQVGLIKVDIEGFEQEFLKGALETIKTQKPILLLSIYHNMDDFFNIKPLIENLNLGYKLRIMKPVDGGIRGETLLIAE